MLGWRRGGTPDQRWLRFAQQSFVIHDSDLVDSGGTSWHAKIDALLAMEPCQLKFHQPLKPESVKRYARQVVVRQNYHRILELPHSNPDQIDLNCQAFQARL